MAEASMHKPAEKTDPKKATLPARYPDPGDPAHSSCKKFDDELLVSESWLPALRQIVANPARSSVVEADAAFWHKLDSSHYLISACALHGDGSGFIVSILGTNNLGRVTIHIEPDNMMGKMRVGGMRFDEVRPILSSFLKKVAVHNQS